MKVSQLPVAEWEIVRTNNEFAKKRHLVRCLTCHETKWIYVWSWAGHGVTACGSGKHRLQRFMGLGRRYSFATTPPEDN